MTTETHTDAQVEAALVALWPGRWDEYLRNDGWRERVRLILSTAAKMDEPVACDVVDEDGRIVAERVTIEYADELLREYRWEKCRKTNFLVRQKT